jgi:hypothetical protein
MKLETFIELELRHPITSGLCKPQRLKRDPNFVFLFEKSDKFASRSTTSKHTGQNGAHRHAVAADCIRQAQQQEMALTDGFIDFDGYGHGGCNPPPRYAPANIKLLRSV